MLQNVCNWIILIGAVTVAITNLYKFFKTPADSAKNAHINFFNENFDKKFEEAIPSHLKKLADHLREEREEEFEKLLEEIEKMIDNKISSYQEEIEKINISQNETIQILVDTSKDMLREKIMAIYHRGKATKSLMIYEKEALDQYYKDYKREGGNSYIDKYYGRMNTWKITDTDDEDLD